MQYIEDLAAVRQRANTTQGAVLIQQMRADVEWFSAHFSDDPQALSGWGHAYFCSEDGAFLTFDRAAPHAHACPVCGKVFSGGVYDAAWIYLYRYAALMSALEAATLYRLEQRETDLSHFCRIVGFYSDHYAQFEEHGKGPTTSGNGKITPQALNEAIFLTKTVNGLEMLKDVLPQQFIHAVSENLLVPGAQFIDRQKHIIHNIPCWINAGVATVGLFTHDDALIERAFDAPLGFCDQVRQGVTESDFWYEGSIHYNCFTIEAFLNTMLFALLYGKQIPDDVRDTVYRMMLAPCRLAFSNGTLPNPNDGWPNLNLKTYSWLYEVAAKVFDCAVLSGAVQHGYTRPRPRTPLPMSAPIYCGDYCMEWLLFSRDQAPAPIPAAEQSHHFAGSNYAVLRQTNVEAFLKYGHRSPSHAHPDKMNLEVSAFGQMVSRDLSNCGYAARLCNEFHRTSVSHNTVVVNGESHPGTEPGQCLHFDPQTPAIKAFYPEAYPGMDFTRAVSLSAQGLEDCFTVAAEQPVTADWFFHCEGTLQSLPETSPAALAFDQNGYQHLQNVRQIATNAKTLTLKWRFPEGVTGVQTLSAEGVTAYLCESYDNPVNRLRTTVILRAHANRAVFSQSWAFSKEEQADG